MRKVVLWVVSLALLSCVGWSLAARIAPNASRGALRVAARPAVAASGVSSDSGADRYSTCHTCHIVVESLSVRTVDAKGALAAPAATFSPRDTIGILANLVERGNSPMSGAPLAGAQVIVDVTDSAGAVVTSLEGLSDEVGETALKWRTGKEQATGRYTATVVNAVKKRYQFDGDHGTTAVAFEIR